MDRTFKIKGPKFDAVLQHSAAVISRKASNGRKTKKRLLWLVKDSGVYVTPADHFKYQRPLCYVPGFTATCDLNKQREVWGGSDFVIEIEIPPYVVNAVSLGKAVELHLTVSGDRLTHRWLNN